MCGINWEVQVYHGKLLVQLQATTLSSEIGPLVIPKGKNNKDTSPVFYWFSHYHLAKEQIPETSTTAKEVMREFRRLSV